MGNAFLIQATVPLKISKKQRQKLAAMNQLSIPGVQIPAPAPPAPAQILVLSSVAPNSKPTIAHLTMYVQVGAGNKTVGL